MKKLLSVVLSLLMVFSALPFTMMASAATVTAAGYTFDWIRGSDGANDFDEVITPAGDALTTKDYNDKTCMTTSRNLVDGDKLVYTTKDSVAKGLYKVIFELRANTGRADLNIKVGDRDYGKFVSPGGGTDTKVVLFTDYVQAETAPVTIEFVAKSTGSMYIEQLHFEKIDYEYSLDGNNATLTKYIGAGGDIEIPEKIDGYTVVGVGADCFKGCETLTSVKAYKNVAKIDEGAFADCVNLEKITIDNGACEIFDSAETISDTAIISGGNKSTAQAYAEKYGREFEMITFATIGDEPYSSLEEAFAAAQDGDRIVLVKDYDLTSSITTDKAVVLDLAGYTLKAPTATITTTADFEIASTAEGKGEVYSGAETVEPSTDADKIGTVADVSNKALYVKGHYPSTGAAKIASYENRVAIKKLIAVDYGKNYIFNTGSGTVVTRFIIREYKADGSFVKSYGGVADGDTYTPSSADVEAIGITIYIDGNSSYDIFGSIQSGAFTPSAKLAPVRAQIKFGSAFVKTSADFKMSNIKVTASATGSFYEQTDANATPKFTAYDCNFVAASTSVIRPLKFSPNASQIDMQNSTVTMGNNNNGAGFSVASASVGTFKNVSFSMSAGVAVYIYNTGAEGITFDGCTVKQSGYDQVAALRVANGNVTLTGGTNISGDNKASNVLYVEGGKLTMDGVTVTGDKGTDTSRIVFYIKNTPTIIIKKANIVKGTANGAKGVITNDITKFRAAIAEGAAAYKTSTVSPETIVTKDAVTTGLPNVYIRDCEHYCVSSQEGSKVCAYCLSETEIYHDYSAIKYDATHHWGVCARCDELQEKIEHEVGENGKDATCTTKAVCGVCNQEFGEPLGHSFTDYQLVSTDIAGCDHNPVTKAICNNGCGEEDYDYSALTNLEVTKEAIAPTCTEKGATQERSCTQCQKVIEPSEVVPALGHAFGEIKEEVAPDYLNTGKGSHVCTVCNFEEEVIIPVKEFKGSTVAIIGDYVNPVEYKTIKDAVDAANDGDVIILVKDVTVDTKITVDKDIILDLAGYKFNAAADGAVFTTTKNFELRSTVLGLGKVYSGVVDVQPSQSTDKFGTIADVPNTELYVPGHYNTSGAYEENTNRIAVNKLIAVDNAKSYIFKTGCSDANVQFVVREYDEKGEFTKSIGAITNGSTYTPTKDFAYHISVAIWESGDTTSDLMGMLKAGEINPTIEMVAVKGVVSFAKPFVKTSAQFKMSNIKASATASTTFIESSATEVATAAKFIAKDCQFTASGTAQPLKFTANAIELDIQDSTIYSTTGNGLEISSSGVFGTIKNTKITKNSSNAFIISKTAPEGIVFDGVTASQGGWDSTASTISGGTVLLTGGTEISGSNMASTVLNISGGNVTLDGVKIYGDKGSDTNRRLINFASDGLKVQIKKAYFATGTANGAKGLITNDNARLFAALADDHAFYYEKTPSGEFAYTPDTNFKNLKVLYADICTHDAITADCDNPGECLYCLHQFDALGHDNLGWKVNDEGKHYKVCSRCELIDENYTPEAHFGGEAECDVQAKCEACGTYYGDVLGHDFTDKLCYDEAEHWIGCNREGCVARSEVEAHKGGKAECEAKAVCEVCKQEYGEVLGHSFIDYISNNDAGCTTNATETAECVHGCGNTDTRIVLNSSLGHNWEVMPEIPATCCKTGLTEGSKCSRCDIVKIEQEVIPKNANAHKWDNGKLTTQGDCAHDAIYTYTCELCKTTSDINFGKVTNKHTYSSTFTTDVKATYFKAGSKSKHCIHCDAKTSVTKIAKKKLKTPKLSVTAGTGKLTVKYKKVKGSTNYQVKYVVNGKTKTLTFKAKQKTAVIKKLKAGKYKVQIRAMVKSGSKKAYSSWSKAKTYTVK